MAGSGRNRRKLCSIRQSKKCKGAGANKNRELGLKDVGIRKSKPPCPVPPPPHPTLGTGSVQEARKERVNVLGSGRNRINLLIAQYLATEKGQRGRSHQKWGAEPVILEGTGNCNF